MDAHIIVSKQRFPYLVLGRAYTVNNYPTWRLFRKGDWSEWIYTNVLIRFSHNLADVTRYTVLGHVSSYIWRVEMGQYHVGDFLSPQVFIHFRIMGQAHDFFPVFFRYHYLADHFPFILHSGICWSPFSHQYLVFHEILLPTIKSFPSQKVITDIYYCLLKNRIITQWPLDLDCIKVEFILLICI